MTNEAFGVSSKGLFYYNFHDKFHDKKFVKRWLKRTKHVCHKWQKNNPDSALNSAKSRFLAYAGGGT